MKTFRARIAFCLLMRHLNHLGSYWPVHEITSQSIRCLHTQSLSIDEGLGKTLDLLAR